MNTACEETFATRLSFPGLVAWSMRTGGAIQTRRLQLDWLTTSHVEQVLARLASAAEGLRDQASDPVGVCWVFERLRLYLVLRPDGDCLALFVENRPDLPSAEVSLALDEFLGWGNGLTADTVGASGSESVVIRD